MTSILGTQGRATLERFARGRTLVALDFDGTLAPIVTEPDAAAMRPRTARLLATLARRYPCVVVSGRARKDVKERLRSIPLDVIGNHGVEGPHLSMTDRQVIARAYRVLAPLIDRWPWARLEDKTYSLALHYRKARNKAAALAALRPIADRLSHVRVFRGKYVLNIVPRSAPHKGDAVEDARVRHGCECVIYAGDDETDEDVFRAGAPQRLLGIRVGRSGRTHARFLLARQRNVDGLLTTLVRLRPLRSRSNDARRTRPQRVSATDSAGGTTR